jgi:hypothetical protein
MPAPETPTEELASFDPLLAEAVTAVLLQAGVPAALGEPAGGERTVLVPRSRREEALAMLAARMDEVQALATTGAGLPDHGRAVAAYDDLGDAEDDRPLVLDRFRSFGWVAVALVPLLIISLANIRLPSGILLVLVIGSVVILSAWRTGRFPGGEQ